MGSMRYFLITFFYDSRLLKCALGVEGKLLSYDCKAYPNETESREELRKFLPQHVRELGTIADVEELFDVSVVPESKEESKGE